MRSLGSDAVRTAWLPPFGSSFRAVQRFPAWHWTRHRLTAFTFCSQTWTAIFAPHNYLEWGLKPSQLMSPRLLLSLRPTPLTCKLQLAKCQQKLLLLPMRWITLAVKIISDVLLRCLMGLLFKHG